MGVRSYYKYRFVVSPRRVRRIRIGFLPRSYTQGPRRRRLYASNRGAGFAVLEIASGATQGAHEPGGADSE